MGRGQSRAANLTGAWQNRRRSRLGSQILRAARVKRPARSAQRFLRPVLKRSGYRLALRVAPRGRIQSVTIRDQILKDQKIRCLTSHAAITLEITGRLEGR